MKVPNSMPNFTELSGLFEKYFPGRLSEFQIQQYKAAFEGYLEWNAKINLVSRKDLENLASRHFLHSLAISKVIDFKPGTRVLDAGTGGGFPGIPLAIFFPETRFTLVDSVRKKLRAAEEIADRTGLKNVQITVQRLEETSGKWDFAISRALADWDILVPWLKDRIQCPGKNSLTNGILYLKGGNPEEEKAKMAEWSNETHIWQLSDWFEDEWFQTKIIAHLGLCPA